jgi:dihydrofolate reductase
MLNKKKLRKIVYYVAASIDGFISGPDGDIRGFEAVSKSDGIEKYLQDLKSFDTIIMGRKTYEFGYNYGLKPGKAAYPHMDHYIFSKTLQFDEADKRVKICDPDLDIIKDLKNGIGSDIYLCGGGEFAGWLLDHEMIDVLKIKLNPLVLGKGTRLFGPSTKQVKLDLTDSETYTYGLKIISYSIYY